MSGLNRRTGDTVKDMIDTVQSKLEGFERRLLVAHGLALKADANFLKLSKGL
jgi:hypothetical protein